MSVVTKKSNKVGGLYYKTTKAGKKMFNIFLTAERLRELLDTSVDAKGQIRLSALENDYKEKDTQPDMNIVEPSSSNNSSGAGIGRVAVKQTQGAPNARAKGSNFPF